MSDLNLNKESEQPDSQSLAAQAQAAGEAAERVIAEDAARAAAQNTASAAVSADDANLAMLAHLLSIVFGFIAPLIIWMISKDQPQKGFVADQAKEALNFQITVIIALCIAGVLMVVFIGILLVPMILVVNFVLCILAGLKAREGVAYRYPFTLRLLK
ncbi:DUF4870 domain-containing protein [Kingella pumchi]|uniref:DUF4870 domain-containing protein n=1 Tax=Kingella pumchi TaxID=2779506 RepID=A0ABS9NK28_9NEIS|nr:DUF4870 domain-containing protein [Kingella pumchi]MCG6503149.1 DUF4870 domain-containing protein [Kingella pumchi]